MSTLPTYIGASVSPGAGTGSVSPSIPVGAQQDDLLVIFVESENQDISMSSSGWTQISTAQGTGTAGTDSSVRLEVFWKLHSGSESTPTVADAGDHTSAVMHCYRGVDPDDPINVSNGDTAASTTSISMPAVTTTRDNCLVVSAVAGSQDTTTAQAVDANWANAALGSVTERSDVYTTQGGGGGISVVTGTKATAGATGNTTGTLSNASAQARLTFALNPIRNYKIRGANGSLALNSQKAVLQPAIPYSLAGIWPFATSISIAAQSANVSGLFVKPDGTAAYVLDNTSGIVYQYGMTDGEVESLRYINKSFSVLAQDSAPEEIFFKPDGTKMFILGNTNKKIYEYALSSAWDITSASFTDDFSVGTQATGTAFGMTFKPDGEKVYVVDNTLDLIFQYALTAWDISTASYESLSLDISVNNTTANAIRISPTGTVLYIAESSSGDGIMSYDIGTPWDISTGAFSGDFIASLGYLEGSPQAMDISSDGKKFYLTGLGNDRIIQYNVQDAYALLPVYNYINNSASFASVDSSPAGFAWNGDGSRLFYLGETNDTVYQFNASEAFNPRSLTNSGNSMSVAAEVTGSKMDIACKPDGSSLYVTGIVTGDTTRRVFQYDLSSPNDLSTGAYASKNFTVGTQDATPRSILFKPDGLKMYMIGDTNDNIYQYTLSGAWDISTASYDSVTFSFNESIGTSNAGGAISSDGKFLHILGSGSNGVISQFLFGTPWDVSTLTYGNMQEQVATGFSSGALAKIHWNDTGTALLTFQPSLTNSIFTWPFWTPIPEDSGEREATLVKTISNLTLDSDSTVENEATLTKTISNLSTSTAVDVQNNATLSKTLSNLTLSSEVDVLVQGSVSKTISNLSINADAEGPGSFTVVAAGQSNAQGYFDSPDGSSDQGELNFEDTFESTVIGSAMDFIDGATNGSALLEASLTSGTNYWYDDIAEVFGDAWDEFETVVTGEEIAAIIWDQGESDFGDIASGGSAYRARYKAALQLVFEEMRSLVGDVPIIIVPIGRRGDGIVTNTGYQTVWEIQKELADALAYVHLGPEKFDQPMFDGPHMTDEGYEVMGVRLARKLAKVLGFTVSGGVDGPEVSSVTRSSNILTVNLTHDGGTDFTPTSGIEGFRFTDNGSEIAITAGTYSDSDTISLTLASIPSGVEILYYAWNVMNGVDYNDLVVDNNSVPLSLRRSVTTLARSWVIADDIVNGSVFQHDARLAGYNGAQLVPNLTETPDDGSSQTTYDGSRGADTNSAGDDPTYSNKAWLPDGGDFIRVGGTSPTAFQANLSVNEPFTFLVHAKAPGTWSADAHFFSCGGNNAATRGILLRHNDSSGNVRLSTSNGSATATTTISGTSIAAGAEYKLAFTLDPTTGAYKVYIDSSTPVASGTATINAGVSTSPFNVFNLMPTGAELYGFIMYDEVLSNTQVGDLFNYFDSIKPRSASLSKTLSNLTIDSDSTVLVSASLSKTLSNITANIDATVDVKLTLTKTISNLTTVTAVDVENEATLTQTIDNLDLNSTVDTSSEAVIEVDVTLDNLTLSSTVESTISASVSKTIGNLSTSTAVDVQNNATVSKTFNNLTLSSEADVLVRATLSKTLGAITSVSDADNPVSSSVGGTISNLSLSSLATVDVSASVSKTINNLTSDADATVLNVATFTRTMGNVSLSSATKVEVKGSVSKTIGNLSLTSQTQAIVSLTLNKSIGIITCEAFTDTGGRTATLDKTLGNIIVNFKSIHGPLFEHAILMEGRIVRASNFNGKIVRTKNCSGVIE